MLIHNITEFNKILNINSTFVPIIHRSRINNPKQNRTRVEKIMLSGSQSRTQQKVEQMRKQKEKIQQYIYTWRGYGNESFAGSKLITATFLQSDYCNSSINTQFHRDNTRNKLGLNMCVH